MSDWSELFQSDSFRAYRRKQAEKVAEVINNMVCLTRGGDPAKIEQMSGALLVMNSMLTLPETLTNDDGLQEILRRQLEEDLGNITTYLMREALRD